GGGALPPRALGGVLAPPRGGGGGAGGGGRPPLIAGFATLLAATVLLAWGVHSNAYPPVFPGLLLYGIALALILTVNDPVSLDMVPAKDRGQVSGVSATAEHFGGAVGIAVLYVVFHATYVHQLQSKVSSIALPYMTRQQSEQFRNEVAQAIGTGVRPSTFNSSLTPYLLPARAASEDGYSAAFLAVSLLCVVALVLMIRLIRKPPGASELAEATSARSHAVAGQEASPGTYNDTQETIAEPQQSPAARTAHADAPMSSRCDAELASPVHQESAATAPPKERPTRSQGPTIEGSGKD